MKRKQLLSAITCIKPAISNGKTVEGAGLVIFNGKEIVGCGDEITVSVPFETSFKAAIPADELTKLVQKMSGEDVDVKMKGNQVILSSGSTEAGFNTAEINIDELPASGASQTEGWLPLPENFCSSLGFCTFSACDQSSMGALTNLCVCAGSSRVVSSDNLRITEKNFNGTIQLSEPLLIPKKIAIFLSALNLTEFIVTDRCAHYRDENGVIFSHRLISDEFPLIDEFLNLTGEKIELPEGLINALGRAGVMSDEIENMRTVSICITKDKILVKGEGVKGWVKEKILSLYKGKKVEFVASPEHLVQILGKSNEVVAAEAALLFTGEDFRHVVSLISEE